MHRGPLVSVIVPNYQHARYLQQRMESIFQQTWQDIEVIILDDCSADDSRSIIAQYSKHPKVKAVLYNETNSGSPFRQWQKGISMATGDYVWLAESDDYCEPGFLECLLSDNINDNAGLRCCHSIPVDGDSKELADNAIPIEAGYYKGTAFYNKYLLKDNGIVNASSVIVKRDLLQTALTDDILNFRVSGDWVVWSKLCLQTDVYYTTAIKNYHRNHDSTLRKSFNTLQYYREFSQYRNIMQKALATLQDATARKQLMAENYKHHMREEGLYGCELVRNGKYISSLYYLLRASLFPRPTTYFIRSAFYWLTKRNAI